MPTSSPKIVDKFGETPTVETVDQLRESIVLQLDYADQLAAIDAEEQNALAQLREQFEARRKLEGDTTIAQRVEVLKFAADQFVREHPEEVFTDGKKTAEFPEATLTSRDNPPALIIDGKRADIIAKLTKGKKLIEAVGRLLKRLKLVPFITLKTELDVSAIKKAAVAGEVTPAQLKRLGMKLAKSTTINISRRS